MTFIFENPQTLSNFFINHCAPASAEKSFSIQSICIHVLEPISDCQLTGIELLGAIKGDRYDEAPNLERLVQEWRVAFRAIPKDHQVQELIFDMSCKQKIHLGHIAKLLQSISTSMYMKAQLKDYFACKVQGCGPEDKEWLEKSVIGVKKRVSSVEIMDLRQAFRKHFAFKERGMLENILTNRAF